MSPYNFLILPVLRVVRISPLIKMICATYPSISDLIKTISKYSNVIGYQQPDFKQLLDEVFVISGIIKVEVSVISRSRRLRLITLTETLIIPDITKTESNNCFIIHCLKKITTNALSQRSQFLFKHLKMYN